MSVNGETSHTKSKNAILIILSIQCVYEASGLLVIFIRVTRRVWFNLSMALQRKSIFICEMIKTCPVFA